jgi:hypothetical protein
MTWQQQAYTNPAPLSGNISLCQHNSHSRTLCWVTKWLLGRESFFYVCCHSNETNLIFLMFRHDVVEKLRDMPLRFVATNKRELQSSWIYVLVRRTSGRWLHCILQQLFPMTELSRLTNALIIQPHATHEAFTFLVSVYAGVCPPENIFWNNQLKFGSVSKNFRMRQ